MKIAILGLAQSGKRTLFKLLTGRSVSDARKPSDSVEGVAHIRDIRVDKLANIFKPEKKVYAENHYVLSPDLAEGSGNMDWLASARKCDLICLLIRSFENDQVYHPMSSINPERDRDFLLGELILADMQIIEKRLERIQKEKRAGQTPQQVLEEHTLRQCMNTLEENKPVKDTVLQPHEYESIKSLELVTAIPVISIYNVSEDNMNNTVTADAIHVSCRIEQEIMDIESVDERREFMESLGLTSSGLDRVNSAAYDALGLMSFYTVGKDECRAWTIRKGSTAPVAGGKIHTDIERGFIRVEVIKYDDLLAAGSEQKAKEQGKTHLNGKDYIIMDGDICHFLFNV